MILPALFVGGSLVRRLLSPRHLLLAAAAGLLAGGLAYAVPAPSLARALLPGLVLALSALLSLPLVAALPAADRAGGYEQLQALRPIPSLAWSTGRALAAVVSTCLLALVVGLLAVGVAGRREMPARLTGLVEAPGTAATSSWRFPVPAGASGPFDLRVAAWLPLAGSGTLTVTARRGAAEQTVTTSVRPAATHTVALPDLGVGRGDAWITLHADDGLVLSPAPPTLDVGREPLAAQLGRLPSRAHLLRLAFAALTVLAAACAFHFETACLAGLLVLLVERPGTPWGAAVAVSLLLLFATLGVALVRRQVLP